MPLVKSEAQSDGRIRVWGIASDHSKDLDGEVIKASENPDCLDYGFIKFDLNHNSVLKDGPVIGDVTAIRILKNADARKKYPQLVIEGDPVEVEGFVYPLGSRPPKDLELVHHYAEVGAGLGFSLFGSRQGPPRMERGKDGRMVPVTVPGLISTIAITPQPKNHRGACYIAKSLSGVMSGQFEVETAQFDPATPRWVLLSQNDFDAPALDAPLLKDLSAPAAPAGAASVSADSGGESFEGRDLTLHGLRGEAKRGAKSSDAKSSDAKSHGKTCDCCGESLSASARFCPCCGVQARGASAADDELEKGLLDSGIRSGVRAVLGFEKRKQVLKALLQMASCDSASCDSASCDGANPENRN